MSVKVPCRWFLGWALLWTLSACGAPEPEQSVAAISAEDPSLRAGAVGVRLTAERTGFRTSDVVSLRVTFRNRGAQPARMLAWDTAAGELEEDLFQVTREGRPVAFIGPHYKRPAPVAGDYVTLAPGESLTRVVDLSGSYDFSQTGTYRIRYAADRKRGGSRPNEALASNEVRAWIEGRSAHDLRPDLLAGETPQVIGGVSFIKCSSSQQSDVLSALGAASAMTNGAASFLGAPPSASPRFAKWFGTSSSAAWDAVKNNFLAVKDALDTKSVTLNCGCKKPYFAYVYADEPYKIHLCKEFWTSPMTGTDSKGGTIVHEMSHFDVVARTDDYVYGQRAAAALAISDPEDARNNADNYEYFAENNPMLP